MQYYKLNLYKNYDQFQGYKINSNPFGLEIVYEPLNVPSNDFRCFMQIWKESNEEDKRKIQILRDTAVYHLLDNKYICRVPFDNVEDGEVLCFRVYVMSPENEKIKTSAIQRILPMEQVVPPDIEEDLSYDYVQQILADIDKTNMKSQEVLDKAMTIEFDVKLAIKEWIGSIDIDEELLDIIDERTRYLTDLSKEELKEELKQYLMEDVYTKFEESFNIKANEILEEKKIELEHYILNQIEIRVAEGIKALSSKNDTIQNELDAHIDNKLTQVQEELNTEINDRVIQMENNLIEHKQQVNADVDEKLVSLLTTLDQILGRVVTNEAIINGDAEVIGGGEDE